MNRLYNLDYLRGLAAFAVMIYHYLSWTSDGFTADTFMCRLGIYGVSIFYILSGLTLYHVYYDKMKPSKEEIISFFRKRIFRIFPLLWIVTILALILSKEAFSYYDLFLNLSGLFGFIKWDTYFSAGVWSIGNELVFYVFFPVFLFFTKSMKPLMVMLSITLLGLYLYFTFVKLNPAIALGQQWKNYVNPLNQVFLFLSGFFIGHFFHNLKVNNSIIFALLILALTAFTFYPAAGDAINLVTGTNRLVFTLSCLLICFSFYKFIFKFPEFIHQPLTLLGETSYSIYLLHPIVWTIITLHTGFIRKYVFHLEQLEKIVLSVSLTLLLSYFVYQYFEKYFVKLGRSKQV